MSNSRFHATAGPPPARHIHGTCMDPGRDCPPQRVQGPRQLPETAPIESYGRRKNNSPLIGPCKEINKLKTSFVLFVSSGKLTQKLCFLTVSRGPGGFGMLRMSCRIHFHLSWCLSNSMVPSYGQRKLLRGICFPCTVYVIYKPG